MQKPSPKGATPKKRKPKHAQVSSGTYVPDRAKLISEFVSRHNAKPTH